MSDAPIGVFDSGVGGLTVVKEVRRLMPTEDIIYFGDTARVPYGSRSRAEIVLFMQQILQFFVRQQVKAVIVACNTMTALGLAEARLVYPFALVGMDTGIEEALALSGNRHIGVIATAATIASGLHARHAQQLDQTARIFSQPCPKLVPLIEQGIVQGDVLEAALRADLGPLQAHSVDVLIMGCTHYPFIEAAIANVVGPAVRLVDPARSTAVAAQVMLAGSNLLTQRQAAGNLRLCFSAETGRAGGMAALAMPRAHIETQLINLEDYC